MWRRCIGFLHHALDLFQLFHQMKLRRQTPGGIDQHHIPAARLAGAHGIKRHSRRVAAFLADDFYRVAVGPDAELLARGGAEGVGRGQQHRRTFGRQVFGELADGRGFACAIDAGHHDDGGLLLAYDQRLLKGFEQSGQ